jgi:hypothetical protein
MPEVFLPAVLVATVGAFVLAAVVAGLASHGEIDEWSGGLLLGLALWIGFPFVLWTGAMIHEDTPWKLGRHPRRRLARQAAGRRRDRERLAVSTRPPPTNREARMALVILNTGPAPMAVQREDAQ